MLVLQREPGQSIAITTAAGDRIVITLTQIRGGRAARIGIDAPASVKILRTELEHPESDAA